MPTDNPPEFRRMVADDLAREDLRNFQCGSLPWEDKVAEQLRSGHVWRERNERTTKTYLYLADGGNGEIIGFATTGSKTIPHQQIDGSWEQIRTMFIAWFAVAEAHQRRRSETSHADDMIADLAVMAYDRELHGFSAFVDDRNTRAMKFWARKEFVPVEGYLADEEPDGSRNVLLAFAFKRR